MTNIIRDHQSPGVPTGVWVSTQCHPYFWTIVSYPLPIAAPFYAHCGLVQCSWDANSNFADREISTLLRIPEIHDRPDISPTWSTLSQLYTPYSITQYSCKIHFNDWHKCFFLLIILLLCQPNLTLILLTWRIGWVPNNASRWQMGFNSAFKGLR